MPGGDDKNWTPPVNFYFRVEFQWGSSNDKTVASFLEVSGLDEEVAVEAVKSNIEGGMRPTGRIKHGNIVLKRPLKYLNEDIRKWVKECFSFTLGDNRIRPCLVIISLLNPEGKPCAGWECSRAFPVKWSLDPMNSSESKLAIESLTLCYSRLSRRR